MKILVSGGAGYIGSHTCVELIQNGYNIIIADNFSNSSYKAVKGIETITNSQVKFYEVDVCCEESLRTVFNENKIDAIIHFAGFKAVYESIEKPLMYYSNNLGATMNLCKIMAEFNVTKLVFSSSATVYLADNPVPLTEIANLGAINPYGWTKYMGEQILSDVAKGNPDISIALLRYFNPVGAHESGLIGEIPKGVPNNLVPYISQTAAGILKELTIHGDDYDTPDGTCVRDYVHVCDLAAGHVKAIEYLKNNKGSEVFNLGTGKGASVLEMLNTFMEVNKINVPYKIGPRRMGDNPVSYANPEKAEKMLGFKAERTLEDMLKSSWVFQKGLLHTF